MDAKRSKHIDSNEIGKRSSDKNDRKNIFLSIRHFLRSQRLTDTRKAIILNDLVDAGSPGIDFFILVIFSAAIATFGLLADNSVVTIGAQLIDPLMSPILGLAIASLSGLQRMFRRSLLAAAQGAGLAIALSTILSFLIYRIPYGIGANTPHEVMIRTIATPLDLGIAFVGGAAAAYALAHPRLDAALPGVAIATAIMPPLCTMGYGIAFANLSIFLGATLQFFTNFIAIIFSAILTFAILGFRNIGKKNTDDLSRSLLISSILMLIIAIPLGVLAWNSFSAARLNSQARHAIMETLPSSTQPEIINLEIQSESGNHLVTVTARMSRVLTKNELELVHNALEDLIGDTVSTQFVTLPIQILE